MLRELLLRRGYEIAAEADTGAAAVEAVERVAVDAVLLDVHLPDASGFRIAAQIACLSPALPILLTSADFDDGFYALARQSGATGFVPKALLGRVEFTRFWPGSTRQSPNRR